MAGPGTSRERRLWTAAAGLLVAIYATLYWVRPVAQALRDRGLLRWTVAAVFVAVAIAILRWSLKRAPGWRELATLAAAGLVYLAALWPVRLPEERVHLLEYGVFAGLVYAALLERRRPGGALGWAAGPALLAIALTTLAGGLDEGIQYLLPNRHFDWLDVGLNVLAGVLAVAAIAGIAEARRADARAAPR